MVNECKRCLLRESAEAEIIESIKERIERLSCEERCEKELYEQRLGFCKKCDNLISGVCLKCGCYVEFRAAFKNNKCPDVANRKW